MSSPVIPSQFKDAVPSAAGAMCLKLWKFFSLPKIFYDWYAYAYNEKFITGNPYWTEAFVADLATASVCDCTEGCTFVLTAASMVYQPGQAQEIIIWVCGGFDTGDHYRVIKPNGSVLFEGDFVGPFGACQVAGGSLNQYTFVSTGVAEPYYTIEVTRSGCEPKTIIAGTVPSSSSSSSSSESSSSFVPSPYGACGQITVDIDLDNVTVTILNMIPGVTARIMKEGILGAGCSPKPPQVLKFWNSSGGTDIITFKKANNPSPCGQPTYRVQMFSSGVWVNCYAFQ